MKRLIFASSSSVYGDSAELPKSEDRIGDPLSPYAASKRINEIYASLFARHYGLQAIGLRYFNVFGPRQNPGGPYAAVIPRWIEARRSGAACTIYGDGQTSRDFCYVENVVQANLAAAAAPADAANRVYNIALGNQLTLTELYHRIDELVCDPSRREAPIYAPFREGDVRHSRAAIDLARRYLGYEPTVAVEEGLRRTVEYRTVP